MKVRKQTLCVFLKFLKKEEKYRVEERAVLDLGCGTDSTAVYATQDPNATSSGGSSAHSSNTASMLSSYFIGDLNQTIGQQNIIQTNSVIAPTSKGDDDEYDD